MEFLLIEAKMNQLIWEETCLMDRLRFEVDPEYMATPEMRKLGRRIEKKLERLRQQMEQLEEEQFVLSQKILKKRI